jgi:hypothetical protein
MKFEGTLFKIGKPSNGPIKGAEHHRVVLVDSAILNALKQLPGTPLFGSPCLSTHKHEQIGIIQDTYISRGEFCIKGVVFNDSQLLSILKASAEPLGLSFDAVNAKVLDKRDSIFVVYDINFIGATVLYQRSAAHKYDCAFKLLGD